MSNVEIVFIAMIFSTVIMIIGHLISNARQKARFKKYCKRTDYIKQLVKEDKLPYKLINLNEEMHRIKDTENHNGLIIDNVLYNDKNALFLNENARLYIIGKKEDFFIILTGGFIR